VAPSYLFSGLPWKSVLFSEEDDLFSLESNLLTCFCPHKTGSSLRAEEAFALLCLPRPHHPAWHGLVELFNSFFLAVLGMELRALSMPVKCPIMRLHPSLF
jgi:hypothetical protein